jgi:phosphatidylglycerophosphate synthase
MPPAATSADSAATAQAAPPAVVRADAEGAFENLLGLPHWLRAVLAAQHAGCVPIRVTAAGERADQVRRALADDPRVRVEVEVVAPPTGASDGATPGATAGDPGEILLGAGVVVDTAAVRALCAGKTGDALPATYLAADVPLALKRRALLLSTGNPIDGLVDKHINRRISRIFTRILAPTPITPNAITVFSMLLGVLGCALIALGSMPWQVAGAVIFQLSSALDCTDGEVARLTYKFSPFGARLDLVLDNVVYWATMIALGFAAVPELGPSWSLALGAVAVIGQMCSFVIVYRLWFRPRPEDDTSRMKRILDSLTNRDFSLGLFVCAFTGWWAWLLVIMAAGTNVFWITMAIVVSRVRAEAARERASA